MGAELTADVRAPDGRRLERTDGTLLSAVTDELVRNGAAAPVVAAFTPLLGIRPWLVRWLDYEVVADGVRATVELACPDGWAPPAGLRWRDADSLPEPPAPWLEPAWRAEVTAWIDAALARLGERLADVEQVKHWRLGAVVRAVGDGPDRYLKVSARLPLFVDEPAVTEALAALFPGYAVPPLALDRERGYLLLPPFEEVLPFDAKTALHAEALGRYGALQRAAVERTGELLAAGCHERGLDVLESQLDGLVAHADASAWITAEERDELRRLRPVFAEACRALAALGLPDTLVHGDLFLVNVARHAGELVYFDWTDACVAHPFTDLLSLQWERDADARALVLGAYLDAWAGAAARAALEEAARLARVVVPLHHAVSAQAIVEGVEPAEWGGLDSVPDFLREALAQASAL